MKANLGIKIIDLQHIPENILNEFKELRYKLKTLAVNINISRMMGDDRPKFEIYNYNDLKEKDREYVNTMIQNCNYAYSDNRMHALIVRLDIEKIEADLKVFNNYQKKKETAVDFDEFVKTLNIGGLIMKEEIKKLIAQGKSNEEIAEIIKADGEKTMEDYVDILKNKSEEISRTANSLIEYLGESPLNKEVIKQKIHYITQIIIGMEEDFNSEMFEEK